MTHIDYNAIPKVHGVTNDRQLNVPHHAVFFGSSIKRQDGGLLKLASASSRYYSEILRSTYIAIGRTRMKNGAFSWLPWISNTTLENQERSRSLARHDITGKLRTITDEAIIAEAKLSFIETRSI